ncbi:extracellular matrix protein 2-like [Sinocyclocheilus rhinocerous]|uniref:extracellular matrix protein 2-like n=1 Tax=Sinocyclocheilus rhinocerous TaxID=307959 RepID=UPI0007B891F2|nr:PREDICTED: extracellular matrix protein 2-like [Sinocyclocheilus rhinocerous]
MYKPLALCLCLALLAAEGKREKGRRERQRSSRRFLSTEDAPDYDNPFLPGRSSQCLVNGISLFEGAVWSPEPCSVCQCKDGAASCRTIPCPARASPTLKSVASKPSPTSVGKTSSKNRLTGNGKPPVGTEVLEVKPKKNKMVIITPAKEVWPPSNVPKKQVKKNQEVIVSLDPGKPPKTPVIPTGPWFMRPIYFEHDDHDDDDYLEDDSDSDDDDDDNRSIPVFRSAVRPVAVERRVIPPTFKPAIPRAQPAFALPTRKSVILPTGRPLPAPSGRPVDRGIGRPVISTSVHMESLPAGCLLSESLIACGNTRLTQMPIIKDAGVRSLFLADNKISKIPSHALAGLPNLEWLDLSKNKLDDFSLGPDVFRNLTKLRRLNLDGNNFTKVPALPPSLVELKINDNKLSGLTPHSFQGLSQLLTLELEDNYFHDGNVSPLAFKPLRRLIYLRLDDNKFRAIPSGLPASVQELHLSDNKIEVVHSGLLNKTTNLRVLNLSHNRIREDRIHPRAWIHLLKLEYLDLSHNKLVHVPSFLPVGLRQLILHHNQIERIPGYVFGHLRPGLDSLQLSYNRLREDGINEVSFLGLYNSLTELLLDHNQLRSIPRGILQLKNLQHLRLNHNYISYITMNSLCDTTAREDSLLVSVHLEYNLIDRRLIPPTAFSCIKTYQSVLLRPQRYEEQHE